MFAKLQLMEKSALGGITANDINSLISDFKRTLTRRQVEQRFLLEVEFKNKVADILYFKNGPAVRPTEAYCASRQALCIENKDRADLIEGNARRLPCFACRFYHEALQLLSTRYLGIKKPRRATIVVDILRRFEEGKVAPDRSSTIKELGSTLSSLGNIFISCGGTFHLNSKLLKSVLMMADEDYHMGLSEKPLSTRFQKALIGHRMNKLEEALVYFLVAAWLFRRASDSRSCAQELTKVLWVIRETIAVAPNSHGLDVSLEPALKKLAEAAIQENYRSHEGTHRIEIEKIKEMLGEEDRPGAFYDRVNLGRLSINASITEIAVVYDEIRLTLTKPRTVLVDRRTSPYAMVQSVFSRINALRYRARANYQNFSFLVGLDEPPSRGRVNLGQFVDRHTDDHELAKKAASLRLLIAERGPEVWKSFPEIEGTCSRDQDLLEFLIGDSIYCGYEIIRSLEIYSNSYMASHSMRAAAHRNLATWCDYYYSYLRYQRGLQLKGVFDQAEAFGFSEVALHVRLGDASADTLTVRRMEEKLRQLVGPAEMVSLGPNYHREKALSHFKAANEAHSEGKAYGDLISQMYYLSDDFADQLEQFCASLERLRLNSGDIDSAVRLLHKDLAGTVIHQPDQYAAGGDSFNAKKDRESP